MVKHKALNLVDVGSSPVMRVTSYDVIFNEVYIKSQLSIILLSRPLGATRCCFQSRFSAMAIILSMGMIYSIMEGIVPSRCRLTTRHLGATLFKLRLYQICKPHVAARMHQDTWALMQSNFLLILLKTRLITL